MMLSFGSWLIISRTTVSPPIPESKTPIGAVLLTGIARMHIRRRSAESRGEPYDEVAEELNVRINKSQRRPEISSLHGAEGRVTEFSPRLQAA